MVTRRLNANQAPAEEMPPHCTTIEAAKRLGLAVRSVQMMVDRGELQAWKTAGGHRRIALDSLDGWIRHRGPKNAPVNLPLNAPLNASPDRERRQARRRGTAPVASSGRDPSVLIIEDSVHYQRLLSLLLARQFPSVNLYVASDGVAGLAMCGALQPDVLVVDILLPGIDGATLITGFRSNDQFASTRLIVLTSLDEAQREPYAFALQGLPVVHKTRLLDDLPPLLERSLAALPRARA